MATDMTTHHVDTVDAEAPRQGRRSVWMWVLGGMVVILTGVIVWLVTADDESGDAELPPGLRPVPAEAEQEIDELIDEWMRVWRERDGDAVPALLTDDFRYVRPGRPTSTLDGYDVERTSFYIGEQQWTHGAAIPTERVILERVGYYFVAQKYQVEVNGQFEQLELYTIVDEDGTLKFQFVESWAPLGWHQTADGQPYQAVDDQGLGWPFNYVHGD